MTPLIAYTSHGQFEVSVLDSDSGVRLRFAPVDGRAGETTALGIHYRLWLDLFCAAHGSFLVRPSASTQKVCRQLANGKWVTLHHRGAYRFPEAWVEREVAIPLAIWTEDHATEVAALVRFTIGREAGLARGRVVSYRDLVAKTDPRDLQRMAKNRSALAEAEVVSARLGHAMNPGKVGAGRSQDTAHSA